MHILKIKYNRLLKDFFFSLEKNCIDIWLIHIKNFLPILNELRQFLSKLEIERAHRFQFEIHQQRYIISQSILRVLLSGYTKQNPLSMNFSQNNFGKPFLKNTDIKFNISHSYDFAVYAFSRLHEVGIDIEYWRERKYLDGIINANFSKLEQKIYHQLPENLKIAGFYKGWTCNEAFIKAIGMGLSYPLDSFSVEMDPRKPAKLLEATAFQGADINWRLQLLPSPEFYTIALGSKPNYSINKFFELTME